MNLPNPVKDGMKFLAIENEDEYAVKTVTSAVRSRLFTALHGTRVKTEGESTHSIVKKYKSGVSKTLYFTGGMKETASLEFKNLQAMQSKFGIVIPKELTEDKYVAKQCEDVAQLLQRIQALETTSDESAEDEAEQ